MVAIAEIASVDSPVRPAKHYRLPQLLHDIRLLDLLELTGTTQHASHLLSLSQPTVSRRYRSLAADFRLSRDLRGRICRYGSSPAIRLLRHSCRWHRLQAGVARFSADLLHQHLFAGFDWLLPVPSCFRALDDWLDLVRQGVLDGALVSGLELQFSSSIEEAGLQFHRLGDLPLALASQLQTSARGSGRARSAVAAELDAVLVPHRGLAPGLQTALAAQGLPLKPVGSNCVTAPHWLERLARGRYWMPISAGAQCRDPWAMGLELRQLPEGLHSPVWLVLPRLDGHQWLPQRALEQLRAHPSLVH